jgi:hypothetical protein
MTVQPTDPKTSDTARELRYRAVQILARLLSEDLPEVTWTVHGTRRFLPLFTDRPQDHEVLDGHADSHRAVRAWAAHLGASVEIRHGDTPMANAVIDGIGVRVWCAPEHRDDLPTKEV